MKILDIYYRWILVIPPIILLLVLTVYPTLDALYTSFHQHDAMIAEKPFIWFDNYKNLIFEDERYQNALYVTLIFEVITISIQMLLGLFLAFLFSGDFKFKKIVLVKQRMYERYKFSTLYLGVFRNLLSP